MNCYASTYISGFNKIVEKTINELYADCKIVNNFDGLIVYETNKQLKEMPFVNNTYFVFDIKKIRLPLQSHYYPREDNLF